MEDWHWQRSLPEPRTTLRRQRVSSDKNRQTTPPHRLVGSKDLLQGELTHEAVLAAATWGGSLCLWCTLIFYTMRGKKGKEESHWYCVKPSGCFLNLFTFYLKELFGFPTVWSTFLRWGHVPAAAVTLVLQSLCPVTPFKVTYAESLFVAPLFSLQLASPQLSRRKPKPWDRKVMILCLNGGLTASRKCSLKTCVLSPKQDPCGRNGKGRMCLHIARGMEAAGHVCAHVLHVACYIATSCDFSVVPVRKRSSCLCFRQPLREFFLSKGLPSFYL